MIFLSDQAIAYAVEMCAKNNDYRVCIAISENIDTHKKRITEITMDHLEFSEDYYVEKSIDNLYEFMIKFSNNSVIRVIDANKLPLIGFRCYLLIADINIRKEILENVLLPMEDLYWVEHNFFHAVKSFQKENE